MMKSPTAIRFVLSALSFSVTALALPVHASTVVDLAPIGKHVRLFRIEKNENPQNVMIVYSKVDDQCHFQKDGGKALTDVYWMMEGQNYKAVNSMIKSNITKHLEIGQADVPKGATDAFQVQMSNLKEIDPTLDNLLLDVVAKRKGKDCVVETDLMKGKPAKKSMLLDVVYTESKKTLLPPFRELVSLTVKGTNLETGVKESRLVAPLPKATN